MMVMKPIGCAHHASRRSVSPKPRTVGSGNLGVVIRRNSNLSPSSKLQAPFSFHHPRFHDGIEFRKHSVEVCVALRLDQVLVRTAAAAVTVAAVELPHDMH